MKEGVKMKMRGLMVPVLGVGAMSYLLHILSVMVPVYQEAGDNSGWVFVELNCIIWCCFSLTCLCGLLVMVGKNRGKEIEGEKMKNKEVVEK